MVSTGGTTYASMRVCGRWDITCQGGLVHPERIGQLMYRTELVIYSKVVVAIFIPHHWAKGILL